MARPRTESQPEMLRCTESFTTWRPDGVPVVVAAGEEILGNDPLAVTHAAYFEPAAARVISRRGGVVEAATAAPGESRTEPAKL